MSDTGGGRQMARGHGFRQQVIARAEAMGRSTGCLDRLHGGGGRTSTPQVRVMGLSPKESRAAQGLGRSRGWSHVQNSHDHRWSGKVTGDPDHARYDC